jgi:hypothetical protein
VSLVGLAPSADPTIVGRQLARALGIIVCRCACGRRTGAPCERCARFGRSQASALGRALFVFAQGVPFGQRLPTESEYLRIGRLLELIEMLAAGKAPNVED